MRPSGRLRCRWICAAIAIGLLFTPSEGATPSTTAGTDVESRAVPPDGAATTHARSLPADPGNELDALRPEYDR